MPVLTDNYSTERDLSADISTVLGKFKFRILDETSFSSLVVSYPNNTYPNHKILQLLAEFELLEENWDLDGGLKPSIKAIKSARYITQLLGKHGQQIFHAAPGPNGEIMLDIRNKSKNKSVEIIFYDDRTLAVKFPEEGLPEQIFFSPESLPDLLHWLNTK
jgi:hypothetical protein